MSEQQPTYYPNGSIYAMERGATPRIRSRGIIQFAEDCKEKGQWETLNSYLSEYDFSDKNEFDIVSSVLCGFDVQAQLPAYRSFYSSARAALLDLGFEHAHVNKMLKGLLK